MSEEHGESEQLCKLFIGGLNYKTTEESLKSYFEQWGEIVDCVVMRDPHTKRSRGFGFVTYKKAHMVDDAQRSRPHTVDGREVEPKRAVPREDSHKPESQVTVRKIYVASLKDDVEEEDLKAYFAQFGIVVSANLIVDKSTGRKRGFAFIEFDDYDPVDKVVLRQHYIKGMKVEVRKALPRQDMGSAKRNRDGQGSSSRGYAGNQARSNGSDYRSSDYGAGRWGSSYDGGPVRSNGYSQRSQGPYGGGYGGGYSSFQR